MLRRFRFLPLLLVTALAAGGCASSNRLGEVSLDGRRVAVAAAIPPRPAVQAGHPAEAAVDLRDPIGSAVRLGTSAAKYRQAERAQARLDSAVLRVDVADRIARQVLVQAAERFRFEPGSRPLDADYLLDLRVERYSLISDSFEGDTYFTLEGEMRLLEPGTGRRLWHTELREREVLDGSLFAFPPSVGNVVTARALASLSQEEMAQGLLRLADYTAARIVETFRRDYARTR